MSATPDAPAAALRLDKWLWHARFVKTRSLAQKLCTGGHVRLNDRAVDKASVQVRPGDRLTVTLGEWRHDVAVAALGDRRGPAPEARTLYRELAPPLRLNDPLAKYNDVRPRGAGRPTKRDRRAIDHLKGEG